MDFYLKICEISAEPILKHNKNFEVLHLCSVYIPQFGKHDFKIDDWFLKRKKLKTTVIESSS